MKNLKFILIALVLTFSLSMILASCGDDETGTTTTAPTTTKANTPANSTGETTKQSATTSTVTTTDSNPTSDTGTVTQTSEVPVTSTEPPVTTPEYPAEMQAALENMNYQMFQQHEDVRLETYTDPITKQQIENVLYMSFKSEGGHFNDVTDSTTQLVDYGLSHIKAECIIINNVKYEIEYFATSEWYKMYVKPKDFTFVDGNTYELFLIVTSDETEEEKGIHVNCDGIYYWTDFTYNAPDPIVSQYGDINTFIPNIKIKTQLILHNSEFAVDENGIMKFSIKTDNNPFIDNGDIKGISYTTGGKLYINGEEVEYEAYGTEEWYKIFFTPDYEFVSGESYEIILNVEVGDATFCKNENGYYFIDTYVAP